MNSSTATLTKEDRQALLRLLKVFDQFRDLDKEMQLPQAVTLLTIALNEGISLADLTERTSQATSSASRNVALLSPLPKKNGQDGHGLILNKEDPVERRRKQHVLTTKGKAFIHKLIETVGH